MTEKVQRVATLTVCLVPPPAATSVWEQITRARTEFKDPGLFRWPPHVNLLYPFLNSKPQDDGSDMHLVDPAILKRLHEATRQVEPFQVSLERLGTFGGKNRGVLWLYPSSNNGDGETVHVLYQKLVEKFPECSTSHQPFNPHMTVSHFETLEMAQAAQEKLEEWWQPMDFIVNEIYLLQRKGDDGQFLRVASFGLGNNSIVQEHIPPLAFPGMPSAEEDWVRKERLALKARRNNGGKKRRKKPNVTAATSSKTGKEESNS